MSGRGTPLSQEPMAKFLVRQLVQSGLRRQLGCEGVVVVVNWGDDDGANWTIEFVGLPAPRRCIEAAEAIVNELRAKYRLAKDRLSHEELTTLLLNQVRAEIDLCAPPVPHSARPRIQRLPPGGVSNWSAIPGGPVSVEYLNSFNRAVARLQKQVDLID